MTPNPPEPDEAEFEQWLADQQQRQIALAAGITLNVDPESVLALLDAQLDDMRDAVIDRAAHVLVEQLLSSSSDARRAVRDQIRAAAEVRAAQIVTDVVGADIVSDQYGRSLSQPTSIEQLVHKEVRDALHSRTGYGKETLLQVTVSSLVKKWVDDAVKSIADDELEAARDVFRQALTDRMVKRLETGR